MTTADFLKQVLAIADSAPSYREGGTGADGTCDCIGLVMGAMYALGCGKYELHSSNYFARKQTDGLSELQDVSQLSAGMLVYKARTDTARLNARYLPGGSCYNGDLLDYYHAGVVESVYPLSIVHCTSSAEANGIARDKSIGSWTHFGTVSGLGETAAKHTAVVVAPNGKPVNLRKRPDAHAPLLSRVAVGTQVSVSETAQGWARVKAGGETGYMMQDFLRFQNDEEPCVRLPLSAVMEIIETLRAYVTDMTEEGTL